jgi:hypothetical protein
MVSAEFMDIFGVLAFVIILVIGFLIKIKKKKLSNKAFNWMGILLIIVGALGLIVDSTIVIRNFLIR